MATDLVVTTGLSQAIQIVQDQDGNNSSLALGAATGGQTGPSGFVGVVGPGGKGAKATLSLSTFPELGPDQLRPNAGITATDQGDFSAILAFGLQPPGSGTSELVTVLALLPDGGLRMPGLALPISGLDDLVIDPSGNVSTQSSSARFKEEIRPLQDDFHKALLLEPKSFTYRDSGLRGIGYIAEQVDQVELRDLVSYDAQGNPLGVHYKMLSIYLLELVKEQQAALAEIRAEIEEMKGSVH